MSDTPVKRVSTKDAAAMSDVCKQRILTKLTLGHYSGASKCECGLSIMIPLTEVMRDMRERPKRIR